MSAVSQIVDGFVNELITLLPTYERAKFFWDVSKNTSKNPMYIVRPSSGSNVDGTNNAITIDQEFEVELIRKWKPQSGLKDTDLDSQVLQLFEDAENVWRKAFLRRFNISPGVVLVVSVVDFAAPEIDNDNNTVSVIITFTVKYRTSII